MYVIDTTKPTIEEEREPLFTIDGTEYTIPKVVGGEVALEAMELSRTIPDAAVSAWAAETLIGPKGWRALRAVKGLDPAIVTGIMGVCRDRVLAALEDEGKG